MPTLYVNYLSKLPHVSQIITGFHYLGKEQEYDIILANKTKKPADAPELPAAVELLYRNKKIIYDLDDGYQHLDGMRYLLCDCDYYFKRSYSDEKNAALLAEFSDKIFPLGFNYHVSYEGNPINQDPPAGIKQMIKKLIGFKSASYFTPEVFEKKSPKKNSTPRILFYTRLWPSKENEYINTMRIEIIRILRKKFGKAFSGGIQYSLLARSLCPDLILPPNKTNKSAYLKKLHDSDICIGSMGLHESIGWKTGEYVAASKAIVNEKLRYSVPGNFAEGKNYLSFESAEECIQAIERLMSDPELLEAMKANNHAYYNAFLKPDVLVRNTLRAVDSLIGEE